MSIEVGQEAPDFELPNTQGGKTKLSDYRGKKNVLLVFYPLAFSLICHKEFCDLRDENADLASSEDTEVIGISVDSWWSLLAWKKQEEFPNEFVSDFWPHGEIARRYGVFLENRGVATRGTFLIDKQGTVRWKQVNEAKQARDQSEWRKALSEVS